jgi:hypothetical protein
VFLIERRTAKTLIVVEIFFKKVRFLPMIVVYEKGDLTKTLTFVEWFQARLDEMLKRIRKCSNHLEH